MRYSQGLRYTRPVSAAEGLSHPRYGHAMEGAELGLEGATPILPAPETSTNISDVALS